MKSSPHQLADGSDAWALWEDVQLPCRVIAVTHHGEVHGYLLGRSNDRGRAAWRTASGRVRHLLARPSDLQLPNRDRPWEGWEIPWRVSSQPSAHPKSA